jgi:hypothetical protein
MLDDRLERFLPQIRSIVREAVPPPPEPETPPRSRAPWALAALGLVSGLLFALLWLQQRQQLSEMSAQLAKVQAVTSTAPALPAAAGPSTAPALASAVDASTGVSTVSSPLPPAGDEVLLVPFGETPLDGARTDRLRDIVDQLAASGFTGTVDVMRHEGRFCLTGHPDMSYTLTIASLAYLRCDLVADAGDAEIGGGPPESLGFANALADLRTAHVGRIRIEVSEAPPSARDRPYPPIDGTPPRVPTAGEWNSAAQANNRVEIRWRGNP